MDRTYLEGDLSVTVLVHDGVSPVEGDRLQLHRSQFSNLCRDTVPVMVDFARGVACVDDAIGADEWEAISGLISQRSPRTPAFSFIANNSLSYRRDIRLAQFVCEMIPGPIGQIIDPLIRRSHY